MDRNLNNLEHVFTLQLCTLINCVSSWKKKSFLWNHKNIQQLLLLLSKKYFVNNQLDCSTSFTKTFSSLFNSVSLISNQIYGLQFFVHSLLKFKKKLRTLILLQNGFTIFGQAIITIQNPYLQPLQSVNLFRLI